MFFFSDVSINSTFIKRRDRSSSHRKSFRPILDILKKESKKEMVKQDETEQYYTDIFFSNMQKRGYGVLSPPEMIRWDNCLAL